MEYFLRIATMLLLYWPVIVICLGYDRNKLTAVSYDEIAKALYLRVREQYSHLDSLPAASANIKKCICHHITGSGLFRILLKETRVYMHKIYIRLKKENPFLYNNLYEPNQNSTFRSIKVYTNRNRTIEVKDLYSQWNFEEDIFMCLTSNSTILDGDASYENTFDYHFISGEYNLSDNPNSYIAGRFIFEPTSTRSLTSGYVHNLAEVPAEVLSSPGEDVENSYLLDREEREPEKAQSDDPICSLNELERLRVCTLVLSSNYFEGELTFAPQIESINESECFQMSISFQSESAKFKVNRKVYKEWMIECKPDEYYADYQKEYFVSRVYKSNNEVFVYRWDENEDRKIILENRFGKVRFKI